METEWIKCPRCAARVPSGSLFCEGCGTRMPTVQPAADEAPAGASVATRPAPRAPTVSGTAPFTLQVALPKALQVGRRSLVYVRFRALTDLYESVEFALRSGDAELSRRSCCKGRPGTMEHQVSLEVKPQTAGMARIELDVFCRVGLTDDVEIHTAAFQIDVDARQEASFSPTFNISQNQTADRAGDAHGGNINVNLGGLQLQPSDDPARYATDPSDLRPMDAEVQTSPARLTLQGDGCVLQLISDRSISFGRSRETTIPLRICKADGTVDRPANMGNISRFHFRIVCSERGCVLCDGGESPSAYGTRLDGESLPPGGALRLLPGHDLALGIGRSDVELKMNLRLFADAYDRPAGILLDRFDGARQRTCAVWRAVPLGDADTVEWNGSRWSLVTTTPGGSASAESRVLAVGTTVSVGGMSYTVHPFHPTYVD